MKHTRNYLIITLSFIFILAVIFVGVIALGKRDSQKITILVNEKIELQDKVEEYEHSLISLNQTNNFLVKLIDNLLTKSNPAMNYNDSTALMNYEDSVIYLNFVEPKLNK